MKVVSQKKMCASRLSFFVVVMVVVCIEDKSYILYIFVVKSLSETS